MTPGTTPPPVVLPAHVCPKCRKPFATIDTKVKGESRVRYMGCRACGTKGEKVCVPLKYAPIRLVGFALFKRKTV